jgi:N-succinyldiaminopimelate aminotransferase
VLRQARDDDDGYYRRVRDDYRARAQALVDALASTPLRAHVPQGGYFVMADASALGYADDVEACRDLPARVGVGAIPPSAFYTDAHRGEARGYVRLAFCKPIPELYEAGRRLARLDVRPKPPFASSSEESEPA